MGRLQKPKLNFEFLFLFLLASCTQQIVKKQRIPILAAEPRFSFSKTQRAPVMEEETLVDSSHEGLHLYFLGMQERNKGNFEKASQLFGNFLSENPMHVYADRAQYLILDCHFHNHEFNQAIVASLVLENQFPESRKLPEALYKRGLSHLRLGQEEQAVSILQSVSELYPRSPISELAREELNQIKPKNVNL